MNEEQNYIERYSFFLSEFSWHKELILTITAFLESGHTETDIDEFLMSTTKKVETILRESIKQHQGSSEGPKLSGERLLDYAVDCHFLNSKKEPLYHLIYWILKHPRNISHHTFQTHPLRKLTLFILQADEAIRNLTDRLKTNYDAKTRINVNPNETKIKIRSQILRPDGSTLPAVEKVEVEMGFSNGRLVPLDLKPNGDGFRYGEYNYYGSSAGTLSIRYRGFNGGSQFITTSASTVMISPPYRTCPECGKVIELGQGKCTRCGERFFVR